MAAAGKSIPLSAREAETSNLAFESAQLKEGGPRFLLVPCGMVHGHPERPHTTPKVHFENSSGTYLGKYMQAPGINAGARRSGSSGTRPRGPRGFSGGAVSAAVATAPKRSLPSMAASFGAGPRVKRQTVAPSRVPMGAGESGGKLELKEAKKLLKDLIGHKSAWPFHRPVDITKFLDYYQLSSGVGVQAQEVPVDPAAGEQPPVGATGERLCTLATALIDLPCAGRRWCRKA